MDVNALKTGVLPFCCVTGAATAVDEPGLGSAAGFRRLQTGHGRILRKPLPDRTTRTARFLVLKGQDDAAACSIVGPRMGTDAETALLALAAAVLFALAATLWQRATLSLGEVKLTHPKSFLVLLLNAVWLTGLIVQGVAVVLQGAALDRGPLALVQPLLVTTIVFALPLGYFLTAQMVTRSHALGAVVIVAGLTAFALVGDPAQGVNNAPECRLAGDIT